MKLVYVGFSFEHHKNTHAGYHQIKNNIDYNIILDCQREHDFLEKRNKNFIEKIIHRINLIIGGGCTLTILKCIFLSLTNSNLVFHFVYPENTYKWLFYFKRNNKLIATFHQPIDFFHKNPIWMKRIKHFNEIIILVNDLSTFKSLTDNNNIHFIPHGIDTDFYKCNSQIRREKTIMMVGNWLRNFDFANKVFNALLDKDETITVIVICNKKNESFFTNKERIIFKHNISDEELKFLYQQSSLVFFPLHAYTANNAMLEAASCGCTIFVSSDKFDTTYFSETDINYLPVNVDIVSTALLSHLNNFDILPDIILSKKVEEKFSWSNISLHTKKILLENKIK